MLDVLSLDYFDDAGYLEFVAINGDKFRPDDIFFRLTKDEFNVSYVIKGYPFLAVRLLGDTTGTRYYQVRARDTTVRIEIHSSNGIPLIFARFDLLQGIFAKPTTLIPHPFSQRTYVLTNY